MNQFGKLFRISIFGESHGHCAGLTIDGLPTGLPLRVEDFLEDLERRKGGTQKGTTPRQEDDLPIFQSGLFQGRTTGAPLTILFENKNTRSGDYQKQRAVPRPGHADWSANHKYGGFEDYRGGGHFSGRLTVCLVAAGVIAKKLLGQATVKSTILEIGGETDIEAGLNKAIAAKDSVGGIVECVVKGLPAGLGEPFWDSVESVLSHAVFSIPAVKGIEFGAGFASAKMFGVDHNDVIVHKDGTTATNHAGGIVGGISNGNDIVFRIAVKPTSSTPKDQVTLNWESGAMETFSVKGRHDLCIALRVPPVLEAVAAIVLADLMMQEQHIARVYRPAIFHVTNRQLWEAALEKGFFEVPSLHSEGFIHMSEAHQVAGVLDRYYKDQTNLVKLTVDPAKLQAELKYEGSEKLNEKFPHIYGHINIDAVVKVEDI
ncbi:MAG TPA: chorismate synthase [Phnomibacter sp.]|nr:chorismate synthase [Phnomibacter sp.]